ncbi:MAG: AEC family transporter [Thiolinea sp.]
MSTTLVAVFPVFALLVLGHLARRSGFLAEAFWAQTEKGTYYVLFPCLLISRLAQAQLDWAAQAGLAIAAASLPLLSALFCLVIQGFARFPHRDFTSFFQGGVRFNTYIGLALIAVLPNAALTLAALVVAVMIPVINVLCVLAYAFDPQHPNVAGPSRGRRVLNGVARNPLVLACTAGISWNMLGLPTPALLFDVLDKLAAMALPLGLLAVGAGLRLKALHTAGRTFAWSALVKLVLVPALALGLARLLQLDATATGVLLVFAAIPTASSAYILARQMGGNAELMAGIITGQTLLSLLSLPLLLGALGLH